MEHPVAPDAEMGALDLQHDGAALASSVTVKSPPEKLMAFLVTVIGTTCGAQNCGDTTATGAGAGASAEVSLSISKKSIALIYLAAGTYSS